MVVPNAMNQSVSRLLNFARLIRLPNAFSVVSNVIAAQLVFGGNASIQLLFALPISLALYFAGMVGNDVADFDEDSTHRPERVLPSGAISPNLAKQFYWLLIAFGLSAAVVQSLTFGMVLPLVFAVLLVALIVTYNHHAKHYWYGAIVMAACRVVNIYLAASFFLRQDAMTTGLSIESPHLYPLGIGLFVGGVTHFARNEEGNSRRTDLLISAAIVVVGLLAIFASGIRDWGQLNRQALPMLLLLFVLILLPLIRTAARAIVDTQPSHVQKAVGTALRSIIVLDAFVCFLLTQNRELAMIVALLLLPSFLLGRWIRST